MTLPNVEHYDLIGDVHGCGQTLGRLLRGLGYQFDRGAYRCHNRHAIFIGDILDRGPRVRLAVDMVRNMVDAGNATLILGNHEIDVMGLVLPDLDDPFLAPTQHRLKKAEATRRQFTPTELLNVATWLQQCPLWVEGPDFRAVHACWDEPASNTCASTVTMAC